jgi:hypothetical protein
MATTTENVVPAWRWQFSQWQTAVIKGSARLEYFTAPHRHEPLIFGIIFSNLLAV